MQRLNLNRRNETANAVILGPLSILPFFSEKIINSLKSSV